MKFKTVKELGWYAADSIVNIPSGAVAVDQAEAPAGDGHVLVLNLGGVKELGIEPGAELSVVVKDNFLHDRKVLQAGEAWGAIAARGDVVEIPVGKRLVPSKTEVHLVFTRPGDSKIVATTGGLRLNDDEVVEWIGGKSFFRTRPDPKRRRPVTPVMDPEGPLFILGRYAPKNGQAARADFHFVASDVIHGVEKFVTHLLYGDPDEFHGVLWDAFKARVAGLMGKKTFGELHASAEGRVEDVALECCEAFYRSRAYNDAVKALYAATGGGKEE